MKNILKKASFLPLFLLILGVTQSSGQNIMHDEFQTSEGPLEIYHVGHASLYFVFNGKTIHVDPFSKMGDYSKMPKADLILITHAHGDHLDPDAIKTISKANTHIILNPASYEALGKGEIIKNGDETEFSGLTIKAVPAYNIEHKQASGEPFHPKGRDNGYVINFCNKKVYIAGDTENIPEMENLKNIDIAFLPMNLPYTMTPEMCRKAALMVHPKVLFPYHYAMGQSDPDKFAQLMEGVKGIEVRFRQ